MSKFEDNIYTILKEIFPFTNIHRQYTVKYKGRCLYFDFYVKSFDMYVECQGDQHYEYNRFFHGTVMSFRDAKLRDKLKAEYVKAENGKLVVIDYKNSDITVEEIRKIIYSCYNKGGTDGDARQQ